VVDHRLGITGNNHVRRKGMPVVLDDSEILRRGLETFAERGYDATTMRALAERLEVNHNFINDRYGSKANFWRAVIDFALGEMLGQLNDSFADGSDEDDEATLGHVVREFYRLAAVRPQANRIVADESVRDSERLDYLYENYTGEFWAKMSQILQRLIDAGRMPPMPMHLAFSAITGPALVLTQREMARRLDPVDRDAESMADTLANIVLAGLLSSGPRTPR
jgi:TetR/AcrR family transcriptional regulator